MSYPNTASKQVPIPPAQRLLLKSPVSVHLYLTLFGAATVPMGLAERLGIPMKAVSFGQEYLMVLSDQELNLFQNPWGQETEIQPEGQKREFTDTYE